MEGPQRLPDELGTTADAVDNTISVGELMPTEDLDGYLAVGESALKAIRLALHAARVPPPNRILDLPCGHGRVLRWLRAAYPDAAITACDLLVDGVDFSAATFGADPVVSEPSLDPSRFPDRYDLIWVGSLLTHLDSTAWDDFAVLFDALLAPGGVLVATTHGPLVAARMRAGHHYGYPPHAVELALRRYDEFGFAYIEQSAHTIDYGISVAKPTWAIERLAGEADLQVALYAEALWANHQDVVALVKRAYDPSVADRPST